jgi:hypothetical protein
MELRTAQTDHISAVEVAAETDFFLAIKDVLF